MIAMNQIRNSILALLVTSFLVVSCNNNTETKVDSASVVTTETLQINQQSISGKKIMEDNCYLCHSPSASEDSRVAPPMVAIKSHYLDGNPSKKEFEKALWEFVQKPSEDNAKMRGAVKKFGVMPYQSFSVEDIQQIANYMYDYKIDEPEWFEKHITEESQGRIKYNNDGMVEEKSVEKAKTDKEKGLDYALATKKELGKNLMGTIQNKGTLEAVKFCNRRAYPLVDSMATAQNVSIRRVSDKPRNPDAQANEHELGIIDKFKKAIANKEVYEPYMEYDGDEATFYSPIVTNSMCLQCHGNIKSDIEPNVLSTIKTLYPDDAATGYDIDQVRGVWKVSFDK